MHRSKLKSKRRVEPALAVAVLAAALSPGALAQAAAPEVEQVVITASGVERRLFDTPYAVGVVDAQALRAAGPMVNLSEALARVPGLVVSNRSNYAQDLQINSRGFGARAGFGVRGMRLYADGIPASGPDGQGQVSHFDLAGAQRIEVLRGPFTALYGSSSGGVISLVSAAPKERRWSVDGDIGSDGLQQWRLGVEAPLAGGFSVRAQVGRFETDGFRPQASATRTLGNLRLVWEGARDQLVLIVNALDQPALDPLGLTRAQFQQDPDQTTPQALPQTAPGQADRFNTRKLTRDRIARQPLPIKPRCTIETDCVGGNNRCPEGCRALKGPGGADANDREVRGGHGPSFQGHGIHLREGRDLVQHDLS